MVSLHHDLVAPNLRPATVQETFTLETNAGYDLFGTMDLVEEDGMVVVTIFQISWKKQRPAQLAGRWPND